MAYDRVEGYTSNPTKVRDGSDIMEMTYDPNVAAILGQILSALNGIRARLDAGINTKTVTSLATVSL